MAGNRVYVQGNYVDVHDNEVVNLSIDKAGTVQVHDAHRPAEKKYDSEALLQGLDKVRGFFWGESSMAVIFCVCRDCFDYANNMSQFEREFHCKEGLLSNTFRNNPYMHLHIDKWRQNGAKERVLRLVDAYRKAVDEVAAGQIPTE